MPTSAPATPTTVDRKYQRQRICTHAAYLLGCYIGGTRRLAAMHSEIARYEPWIEILGRQIGHLEAMPGFHQAGTDLGRNAVGQRLLSRHWRVHPSLNK